MPDSARQAVRKRARTADETDYGLLPQLLGYNLRRAQVAVFANFQQATGPFDLTPGQFGVLILIRENAGLSQSELGNALGIDRSTMVAVIDRLEARGLVVRAASPKDRRSYALRLSAAGESLVDEMTPRIRAHEAAIAKDLSEAEKATLIDLLSRLAGGN
ncbi:MAG TPA: MarR family transcriptional regulator [Alphaproteobacteria bacterium]|nr:MarR family transcriptional regulator [Alphaproteobacteria bacterium]